ncbi:Glycine betaine/L-proline transport substrate-binding protein ProX (TC 3.A.1.12.1) [hydrothermal vent metagenome]|uniref:Glycine betaine/L-proline transport substrate-binding protein ProX (TC 3.A.1.12.1) n=1 Tax=hydrothermal vent metagenome TaxID=652676 RepID=A0A3B0TEZ7_9ZZZZ
MANKFSYAFAVMGMAVGLMSVQPAVAQEAECSTDKTIDIAEMNWPSAAALARIHAIILGKGYGCNVEIVGGDTVPTLASLLSKGTPAIAPELWTGSVQDAWDKGVADGVVVVAGRAISDGAVEGWWIPKYVAEANPGLKRVEDLPKYAKLFADPDDPSKGRFYSCPPGWGCEIANAALFEAYGLKDSFNLFSPGSGGNLDASIARAFTREKPIVFYYWGPTSLMGKYEMVKLEMPAYNKEIWTCNMNADCFPKGKTSYPSPAVIVATAAWVAKDAPNVMEYLGKVALSNVEISQMLTWGAENKADAQQTAEYFLKNRAGLWTKWVPKEVAERVKASL